MLSSGLVACEGPKCKSVIKFGHFLLLICLMLISLLTHLEELRKWEENYFLRHPSTYKVWKDVHQIVNNISPGEWNGSVGEEWTFPFYLLEYISLLQFLNVYNKHVNFVLISSIEKS